MTEPTPERPRQVTTAGWLIIVGSVFALALVVQRLAGLHTLENQQRIETFLAKPPGSDLGLSVDTVIETIRTLAMVTAGCATAAGILGYQVLQRSRSARVGVTVLAVPLFLAGLVTGGFITSIVAASAAILWLQPARAWFDGTPLPERRPATATATGPASGPAAAPRASSQVTWPAAAPQAAAPARPGTVLWACVLTWVCAGLVGFALLSSAVAMAISPQVLLDRAHQDNPDLASRGVSDAMLLGVAYAMIVGLLLWCIGAAVLAFLVLRRVEWARVVLIVSASVCAVGCLLGAAIGAFPLVIPFLGSALCLGLLLRAEVGGWFAHRGSP